MWSKQLLLLLSAVALLSSSVATTVSATSVITSAARTTAAAAESSTTATDATSTKRITIDFGNGRKATKTIDIKLPSATCKQTITPDKNGYVPPGTCHALYNYYPSFSAAVATSVIFGMLLTGHIVEASLHKTGFCWVIIVGTAWETIAFALRAVSTHHQQSTGLALISQLFVLLAPLWINAFDYMVLARIVHFFAPTKQIGKLKPSMMAFVFVLLDFVSFVVQLIGGSMASPSSPVAQQKKAVHIYMGGIGLQEFFICTFLGIAVKFHLEMLKAERAGRLKGEKQYWRKLLFALYLSLIAISTRIFFRLVQFSSGLDKSNKIIYHEFYIYVFDAAPMVLAIIIWNVFHPGTRLQGPDAQLPPSWLGRKICCCCPGRREKDKLYDHVQLNPQTGDDEEMTALAARGRERSPFQKLHASDLSQEPSRDPSPYLVSRDPSPYLGSRDPSPYLVPGDPSH